MEDSNESRIGLADAQCRLATYGTLAPGRQNHHQLDGLDGRWFRGEVYGRFVDAGWGASLGFPAIVLDPGGTAVDVHVFESADLPAHWPRLDDFEGPSYQRVTVNVRTPAGVVQASIYALRATGRDDATNARSAPPGPESAS
ncbi:gamma-glutamylcyclotransferase [Hamadaea sp. NPDC051192]|uniref:gamma-glutamylcyclotransferase family protein n=1 Tax=Hamadaea sp. NPDC051192 TaxID=3154940 RepID=UPI003413A264